MSKGISQGTKRALRMGAYVASATSSTKPAEAKAGSLQVPHNLTAGRTDSRGGMSTMKEGEAPPSCSEVTAELGRPLPNGRWMLEIGSDDHSLGHVLEPNRSVILGAGRAADLVVADRTVSARHCEVCWTDRGVVLRDLSSKNGLYVGAARVGAALLIEDGASFVMGKTTVTLRSEADDEPAAVVWSALRGPCAASHNRSSATPAAARACSCRANQARERT
jgi:hypothetical protein